MFIQCNNVMLLALQILVMFLMAAAGNARIDDISPRGSLGTTQRRFLSQPTLHGHLPPSSSAPGGSGAGASQKPFPPQQQFEFSPPSSAPGGSGAGASQKPFPPQQFGFIPPSSAPGGSGAGASQKPFPPQQFGFIPTSSAPGGSGAGASQDPFPPQRPEIPSADEPIQRPPIPFVPSGEVIPILVDERDGPHLDGSYRFNFASEDGISRYEQGTPQGETGAVAMQGGWSFTFPDGSPAIFSFVADGDGYRPESDLLPTPHPLPAHAIAQIEFARQQEAEAAASGDRQRLR
ncbi:pupal cuticle protein 20-like [Procambarus clarkii]|uniref:pupal cuticle protein 20-like n=1 Tax=Procambarus clarkii TaxID=6728 RepID=UPI003744956F